MRYSGLRGQLKKIATTASQVNRSIFFASAIIVAAFVPLFSLSGVEGHICGHMAKTYADALAGGVLATFTVTPASSALLLPDNVSKTSTFLVRRLEALYNRALHFVLRRRVLMICMTALLMRGTVVAGRSLGLEFLPKLEEANMWIRASLPATISLEEGNGYVNRIRNSLSDFPESRRTSRSMADRTIAQTRQASSAQNSLPR